MTSRQPAGALRPAILLCLLSSLLLAPASASAADTTVIAPEPADSSTRYSNHYPDDPALTTHVALSNGTVITLDAPPRGNRNAISAADSDNLLQRLRTGFTMPDNTNPRVEQHMQWLSGKQAYLDRVLERASRTMYLAVTEAERRNLPTELALLPIIESAYDPMALSRSQAAGLWQFIPDTGRLFGLRQNSWFDARRDPLQSTRAAYDYLSQLYATFGDWALVLASYNAGPGTVSRAMKRNAAAGLPTDYWSLKLPAETMAYVPRFLAVVALFKAPGEFNVALPNLPNRPYFRTVSAQGPLTLGDIAEATGVTADVLRVLNPGLRRDSMDPDGPHLIHVPAGLDVARENLLAQMSGAVQVRIAQDAGPSLPVLPSEQARNVDAAMALPVAMRQVPAGGRHQVRAKETWYSIARAYNLAPAQLSAANQASLNTPLSVGRELAIPSGGITAQLTAGAGVATTLPVAEVINISSGDRRIELRRRVMSGETMDSIRQQYQVTLAELRAWNGNIQSLRTGQTIILRVLPDLLNTKAL